MSRQVHSFGIPMTDFSYTMTQLAGGAFQYDRAFTDRNYAVVLDGASPFRPVHVDVDLYVDSLGGNLTRRLEHQPESDLQEVLAAAIADTRADLGVTPGDAPSSTVAIVRAGESHVDFLALGDTLIVYPSGKLIDHRLDDVALAERRRYQDRLKSGAGYDSVHKGLLRELQTVQRQFRNVDGGYWIAEANPEAAFHALVLSLPITQVSWFAIATDGAYDALERLEKDDWEYLSTLDSEALNQQLRVCHDAENADAQGVRWPRAKVHDDKTVVVARSV